MGRLGLIAPIAWRNLWRNPRRTIITLIVVAVGVWSVLSLSAMMRAIAVSSRDASLRLLTGEAEIHAPGYLGDPGVAHRMPVPRGALLHFLQSPSVAGWAPRLRVPAIVQSEYRSRAITFLGVVPRRERLVSDLPASVAQGHYLSGPSDNGIVIGADLAAHLKTRLGKRVIVMSQASDGHLTEQSYTVIGIFDGPQAAEDEFAFTGLLAAQSMLGTGPDLSEIAFDAAEKTDLENVVTSARRSAPALDIESWKMFAPLAYALESLSDTYIVVWLTIMFVLMAIGIVNTQLMAVFERTRELGLLQALGMRPILIVAQVALESGLLVGLGIIIGALLSAATILPLRHGVDFGQFANAAQSYGVGRIFYPKVDLLAFVQFGLVIWILGVVATLWPARAAAKVDPVQAMSQS